MKAKQSAIWALAMAVLAAPGAAVAQPYAMGTAFTYQARLLDGGVPAEGDYDFEFTLYDDPAGGSVVAGPNTKDDWPVDYGLFTAPLDFGSDVFTGEAGWLSIGVRPWNSTGAYTYLTPRQELTPAPYSLRASNGVGGPEALNVDAADNVGIGTTTPMTKLEVAGDGMFTGGDASVWSGNKAVTLRQDGSSTYLANMADFVGNGSESNGTLTINGDGGVRLTYGSAYPAGTAGLTLNADGNVGIGTSGPTSLLDVRGGGIRASRDGGQYIEIIDNSAGGGYITGRSLELNKKNLNIQNFHDGGGSPTGQANIVFRTGDEASPMEVMRITESGYVGIGATSPGAKLAITTGSEEDTTGLYIDGGGDAADEYVAHLLGRSVSFPSTVLRLSSSRVSDAGYNFIEAVSDEDGTPVTQFLVGGDGYVGIGTAAPDTRVDVVGGTTVEGQANVAARFRVSASGPNDAGILIGSINGNAPFIGDASGGGTSLGLHFRTSNSERMRITTSGNVGIGIAEPTSLLHLGGTPGVDGLTFPDGTLQTTAATGGGGGYWSESGAHIYNNNAGNVGIGTTSPGRDLEVSKIVAGLVHLGVTNPSPATNASAAMIVKADASQGSFMAHSSQLFIPGSS